MTTIYLANYASMADYECLMDDGVRDWTLDDLARPVVAWVSLTLDIDQWKAAIEEDYRSSFEGPVGELTWTSSEEDPETQNDEWQIWVMSDSGSDHRDGSVAEDRAMILIIRKMGLPSLIELPVAGYNS